MSYSNRFMLLGSGELGRELVISLKRLGCYVVAIGRYDHAPAMQLSDDYEVIDMFDKDELQRVVHKYNPDFIVPEIEAINIDKLIELERNGRVVVPSANAVKITMDRKALRLLATQLNLKTAKYQFASSQTELSEACNNIGFPCVIKPLMSSSGKGQTICYRTDDVKKAWDNLSQSRGTCTEAIVEEFIDIDREISMLTISTHDDELLYCNPIGHTQKNGDYQESWQPANVTVFDFQKIRTMCEKIVTKLSGFGLWGAEFFIDKKGEVYFSEISPRPHDTGLVTLAGTQHLSQFDLHAYAILNYEIVNNWGIVPYNGLSASRSICYDYENNEREPKPYTIGNIKDALESSSVCTKIYSFCKPSVYAGRRIGVILSTSSSECGDIDSLRRSNRKTRDKLVIE